MPTRAGLAWLFVWLACLCVVAAPAAAEPAAAVQPGNVLIRFDTASPNTVTTVGAIMGLGAGETVRGIDVRPATGQLYAVTDSAADIILRTYTLDPSTGAASFVGGTVPTTGVSSVTAGYDFDPTADRIRYVNTNEVNLRIDPANGERVGAGDTAVSEDDLIAAAYDRNAPGQPATTLYAVDRNTNSGRLVRLGAVNGGSGAASPNAGVVNNVAELDLSPEILLTEDGGFDISPSGTAYAALAANDADDNHNLYTIDLSAPAIGPAASLVGQIGNGAEVFSLAILDDDRDGDGRLSSADNCPAAANGDQANLDGDPQGDACDEDDDGDGISDAAEAALGLDQRSGDSDGDGVADAADLCPGVAAATASGCNENPPVPPALTLAVDGLAKSIKVSTLRSKGISFRVEPNMAAAVLAELVGNRGLARKAKAGDVVLGEAKLASGVGRRTMRIRVAKSQRRRLKAKAKLTVRIAATDALGRVRVVSRTVRLR